MLGIACAILALGIGSGSAQEATQTQNNIRLTINADMAPYRDEGDQHKFTVMIEGKGEKFSFELLCDPASSGFLGYNATDEACEINGGKGYNSNKPVALFSGGYSVRAESGVADLTGITIRYIGLQKGEGAFSGELIVKPDNPPQSAQETFSSFFASEADPAYDSVSLDFAGFPSLTDIDTMPVQITGDMVYSYGSKFWGTNMTVVHGDVVHEMHGDFTWLDGDDDTSAQYYLSLTVDEQSSLEGMFDMQLSDYAMVPVGTDKAGKPVLEDVATKVLLSGTLEGEVDKAILMAICNLIGLQALSFLGA